MAWKQLVQPNINISARAGMCLEYVDNAINATQRTYTAQIAHDTAKQKGWVRANQSYPRGVWFVLFWSIDNGEYQGLGHVALAFVDNQGNMQIHDSEVHRGARESYTSLDELYAWFGSVGIKMTFLGWGEGVDGVKLLEKVEPVAQPKPVEVETKKENKVSDSLDILKKKKKKRVLENPILVNELFKNKW